MDGWMNGRAASLIPRAILIFGVGSRGTQWSSNPRPHILWLSAFVSRSGFWDVIPKKFLDLNNIVVFKKKFYEEKKKIPLGGGGGGMNF